MIFDLWSFREFPEVLKWSYRSFPARVKHNRKVYDLLAKHSQSSADQSRLGSALQAGSAPVVRPYDFGRSPFEGWTCVGNKETKFCKGFSGDALVVEVAVIKLFEQELRDKRAGFWQLKTEDIVLHELVHWLLYKAGVKNWDDDTEGVPGAAQFTVEAFGESTKASIFQRSQRKVAEGKITDQEAFQEIMQWHQEKRGREESRRSPKLSRNSSTPNETPIVQYVVGPGDSLWNIAMKVYAEPARWSLIYRVNRKVVSHPEKWVFPGQRLLLPIPKKSSRAYRAYAKWFKRNYPKHALP